MKKFTKLAAVLAALVLALSCFVGCSSGDDDDDAGGSVLEGYWLAENTASTGYYFVGNKMYAVTTGSYVEQAGVTFSISGDEVTVEGRTVFSFSISEDGKTLTIGHVVYNKQSGTPKKM